ATENLDVCTRHEPWTLTARHWHDDCSTTNPPLSSWPADLHNTVPLAPAITDLNLTPGSGNFNRDTPQPLAPRSRQPGITQQTRRREDRFSPPRPLPHTSRGRRRAGRPVPPPPQQTQHRLGGRRTPPLSVPRLDVRRRRLWRESRHAEVDRLR